MREVSVSRRPLVGLVATGSELMEAGEPLQPGQIYESNRAMLLEPLRQSGAVARSYPLVQDSLTETIHILEQALNECDAVVTTGGVSVGEHDLVKKAFESLGGKLEFWKVAIKPGKPFVFGRWREKVLFGLPGNPVSAFVTFLLLVRPALLHLQRATNLDLPAHPGRVVEPLVNRGDRRHFIRVVVDGKGDVRPAGAQASHLLSSLAAANGLVDVPPHGVSKAGDLVTVLRWGP
jgi:molybdopterin molybdotransferase